MQVHVTKKNITKYVNNIYLLVSVHIHIRKYDRLGGLYMDYMPFLGIASIQLVTLYWASDLYLWLPIIALTLL